MLQRPAATNPDHSNARYVRVAADCPLEVRSKSEVGTRQGLAGRKAASSLSELKMRSSGTRRPNPCKSPRGLASLNQNCLQPKLNPSRSASPRTGWGYPRGISGLARDSGLGELRARGGVLITSKSKNQWDRPVDEKFLTKSCGAGPPTTTDPDFDSEQPLGHACDHGTWCA